MKVLWLTSGPINPSTRFRSLPMASRLRERGFECTVAMSCPPKYFGWSFLGNRLSEIPRMGFRLVDAFHAWRKRYDVIVVERELFSSFLEMEGLFRRLCSGMILDVDDGIFLFHPEKYARLARMADVVIACGPAIADYTRPLNSEIAIIPTCVELSRYPLRTPPDSNRRPVLGWIGSSPYLEYLAVAASGLRNLAQRCDFEFRIVAPTPPPKELDLTGVNVRYIPWSAEGEISEVCQFDLGLMPIPANSEWMLYKCNLKLVQYLALGVPAVVSPIGMNRDVVRHGENGFFAETQHDWESVLFELINSPEFRQSVIGAGRKTVEDGYCIEAVLDRFVQTLERAVELGRR